MRFPVEKDMQIGNLFRLSLIVGGISAASAPVRAGLHMVTFSNPPGVPTGHLPDTGGILTPTSHNFVEDGVHVEAFWIPNAANLSRWPAGFRPDAHFHHLENGYETSHGFATDPSVTFGDVQGLYLEMIDGSSFDLVSLDYRISSLPSGTSVRIGTELNPLDLASTPLTSFALTQQTGFRTQSVTGFDNVQSLFITGLLSTNQQERVYWDNIIIRTHSAPIPGAAVLAGAGLALVHRLRRRRMSCSDR